MRAISQHLLHQVKVAVRAAKQDAHSVHFRLDRARSSVHTESAWPGLKREIHGAFAPGFAVRRGRLVAYAIRGDQGRDDGRGGARPRRRTRHQGRRGRTVRFALTDAEYAEVSDAARQAGLARGAYAAEATLALARGTVTLPDAPLWDAVHALDRAALGVRRIGRASCRERVSLNV